MGPSLLYLFFLVVCCVVCLWHDAIGFESAGGQFWLYMKATYVGFSIKIQVRGQYMTEEKEDMTTRKITSFLMGIFS